MHLIKLEMKGFKSFAHRSTLNFEKGVTAVVGPNGCGKSNIADAIRWVLGEQSARSLRGHKMEDVIFSGTDRKKPQGLAEVIIVFDNKSGELPLPYHEVAITRRVYRSGESEYLLNNSRCRLKDVRELLMDTGIGKEGYSIIGQGKIDELLSQKGEERRLLFDEAAGIVKFRVRKEEAEKKMSRTEENMSRLQDIILEIDGQMEPLQSQAEKAEKYLELRKKVNYLEMDACVRDHKKFQDQIQAVREEKNTMQQHIDVILRDQDQLLTSKCQLEEDEVRYLEEREVLEKKMEMVKQRKEELNIKKMLNQQKLEHLTEKKRQLAHELETSLVELNIEKTRLKDLENMQKHHQDETRNMNGVLNGLLAHSALQEEHLNTCQKALEEKKAGIIETLTLISGLKARKERLKAMIEAAEERSTRLHDEFLSVTQSLENLEGQLHEHLTQLNKCKEETRKIEKQTAELALRRDIDENEIGEIERRIDDITKQYDQAHHRKNLLISMEESFEGFNRGVKNVLRAVQQKPGMEKGFHGVVADLLRVPTGYELAVETALAASLQCIVTEDEQYGIELIDYLKKQHLGRVTVLPLNVIKGKNLRDSELKILENHPGASCALDVISFPSPYKQIFENLLGRVIIADDLNTAINIAKNFGHRIKIATIEGDLIQPGGSMTGGSTSAQPEGLLVRKREIEELGQSIYGMDTQLKALGSDLQRIVKSHNRKVERISSNRTEVNKIQEQRVWLDSTLASMGDQLEEKKHRQQLVFDERNQVIKHHQGLVSEMDMLGDQLGTLEQALKNEQEMTEKELADQDSLKQKILQLHKELNTRQIELAEMTEKGRSFSGELVMVNNLVGKTLLKIENAKKEIGDHDGLQTRLHQEILVKEVLGKELEVEFAASFEALNHNNQCMKSCKLRKREVSLEYETATKKASVMKDHIHQYDMKLSKIEWQLQQIVEKLREQHECNPVQARIWLKKNIRNDLKASELGPLVKEMELLGHVHIGALEEYNRVRERYRFLRQQQRDLVESKASLVNIIAELEEHMKQQFREQFDKIQMTFKEVFQRLFNGGSTELILQNPADLLATGIEIMVQPPGKKSQHLSLLSGGEKALTAISLLFGILLVKPSPFCVLDEIEAALDDANVSRFADYLISLSDTIQFVVVTHKKQTMERAGTLYGITMQEKGVSKLLTLHVQEIDQPVISV